MASDAQRKFGDDKRDSLTAQCQRCEVRPLCNGGCPKDRFAVSSDGDPGQNYLCSGLDLFFTHTRPAMQKMAQLLQRGLPPSDVMALTAAEDEKRGPYAPCPCGSGRKFRFCHGDRTPHYRPTSDAVNIKEGTQRMATKKPNILILWGDDIGMWNVSYFSRGMMGYQTPNIDRVANEGVAFTDYYGQQSCTAGRAAFITGQNPIRTGLTKVGMPGATLGLQAEDPTIAELLKPLGYATGQFGKNHLGDRNEFLPTVHGFDEFFGNLYHLNAEEEPELPDYPKDPAFKDAFGPRGVLHCVATDKDDPTTDPRFGRVGKQTIKDTGPLTIKRMGTIDEEITSAALGWMEKQVKADKPFFLWYNSTAMHMRTHLADKNRGKSGQDDYSDRMVTHDEQIGQMLDKLDELGIADNTIVMYSTDNGPENDTWPDAANTPFRSQKDTNWEGAWRVPAFFRWPGKIKAGSVLNGIVSHQDMLPTLLAAAGDPPSARSS